MATVTLERRNDIAKLLTTLATPCGSSCSEHDWHKCQVADEAIPTGIFECLRCARPASPQAKETP